MGSDCKWQTVVGCFLFFSLFFSIFSVVHSVNSPEKAAAARVECRTAGASSSPGLGSTRFLSLSVAVSDAGIAVIFIH